MVSLHFRLSLSRAFGVVMRRRICGGSENDPGDRFPDAGGYGEFGGSSGGAQSVVFDLERWIAADGDESGHSLPRT